MKGGIGWKLITIVLDRDPWKLYLIFLSREFHINLCQRNWVFATNSVFVKPISLQPNGVDLRYFKLWIMLDERILVWNIKGVHHQVEKNIVIRKSEFVTKTQFLLYISLNSLKLAEGLIWKWYPSLTIISYLLFQYSSFNLGFTDSSFAKIKENNIFKIWWDFSLSNSIRLNIDFWVFVCEKYLNKLSSWFYLISFHSF